MEELRRYFDDTKGTGVIATADRDGKVNVAVYSRPHFVEEDSLAFIMRDRLTHHNLQSNAHAAYLFVEEGPGYKGKRLHLTKVKEEENSERIQNLARRKYANEKEGARFLVFFKVDKVLPLIGGGDTPRG
jgi:hypothetical protein